MKPHTYTIRNLKKKHTPKKKAKTILKTLKITSKKKNRSQEDIWSPQVIDNIFVLAFLVELLLRIAFEGLEWMKAQVGGRAAKDSPVVWSGSKKEKAPEGFKKLQVFGKRVFHGFSF